MALQELAHLRRLSTRIRMNAVRMIGIQGFGYLGQAFSSAEIFAVLFGGGLQRNGWDRFVLSPAHYVVGLYAVAAEVGLLDRAALATYGKEGRSWRPSARSARRWWIWCAGRWRRGSPARSASRSPRILRAKTATTWAFLSDGEMEEGQTWEAAMFASHHRARMGRLNVVIDANNSQVDGPVTSVTTLEPLAEKWRAFGWDAREVDGHDVSALAQALGSRKASDAPRVVIARTSTSGGLQSLPDNVDAHFIKLDKSLEQALLQELQAQLA